MAITTIYFKTVIENYNEYEKLLPNEERINGLNCTMPNKNNPFMNILMNEYSEAPEREEACDIDDEIIKDKMSSLYHDDLYRDIDDVFDKKNSSRNFYTMPSTSIPNKQDDYANWLYGIKEKTQKEGNGDRNKFFSKSY
jgi:hypothetical protein